MLHQWGGMFWILSSSFPSPYASLPIILVHSFKLIVVSSVLRMLFQNCTGSFRCLGFFLANSDLAFLFLRLTNGLHLVLNPLYSLWWSLFLVLDVDTDTPTSCHQPHLFPWSSGSVGVAELTSAFFLLNNLPNSWFGSSLDFILRVDLTDSKRKYHTWNEL